MNISNTLTHWYPSRHSGSPTRWHTCVRTQQLSKWSLPDKWTERCGVTDYWALHSFNEACSQRGLTGDAAPVCFHYHRSTLAARDPIGMIGHMMLSLSNKISKWNKAAERQKEKMMRCYYQLPSYVRTKVGKRFIMLPWKIELQAALELFLTC